ncbi:MAG: cob(I)yrinic acid a,c-diamide adenosyltransferase [Lachnospiraceae bacterium]|nr:cob(I)yrinic acid a,c-diamide adenosyltransferase [Lachnospiraceae bacterium]
MIHLYSGEGRGKTSIAVGTAVRMAGAGKRVIYAQFMKGGESSEINILETIPNVEICRVPEEFPFYGQMSEEQKCQIKAYHNAILNHVMEQAQCFKRTGGERQNRADCFLSGTGDEITVDKEIGEPELLVVLDEITYPVSWALVDISLVNRLLQNLPESVELIMTGQNPSEQMIASSDYWSELSMERHPYEKGIKARKGVEF